MLYAYGRWYLEGWYDVVREDVYVKELKQYVNMRVMKLKPNAPPEIVESYEYDMKTYKMLEERAESW